MPSLIKYPPLASSDDVFGRVGREPTDAEATRVEAVLMSLSIKARQHTGRLWLALEPDGAPSTPYRVADLHPTVWDLVVGAAERSARNPDGFSSESAGDYSYQRVGIPGGVGGAYFTEEEVETLRSFRPSADSSVGGLRTLGTTRDGWPEDDWGWYRTRPGTEPIALDDREFFGQ